MHAALWSAEYKFSLDQKLAPVFYQIVVVDAESGKILRRLGFDAVKIHNLYAVKNTPLADQVERGEVTLMERDAYIATLIDFLELLPPAMLVERISGDAPPDYFIGPSWCLDKPAVKLALEAELARRDTWQGKRWTPTA